MIIFEILGLLVALLSIKFDHLVKLIIWIESIRNVVNALAPINYGAFTDLHSNYQLMRTYINTATQPQIDVIVVSCFETAVMFGARPIVFPDNAFSIGKIFSNLFSLFWGAFHMIGLNMCLAYVLQMRARVLDLVVENFVLIDRMSEGMLILNDNEDTIELVNRQAMKFFHQSSSEDLLNKQMNKINIRNL